MALTIQEIPISIKDHFGSERVTNLLREITRKSEIATPGLLPGMIYSLITKDITAHDFVEALREDAGLSQTRSLAVAKEIKERVLEPVRRDLFRWGIDISAINVLNATTLESLRIEEPEEAAKEGAKIPLSVFTEKPGTTISITPKIEEIAPEEIEIKPLILHTNTSADSGNKKESVPISKNIRKFKGFSLGLGIFGKKSSSSSEEGESPIKARLEIPEKQWKNFGEVNKKEEKKTVNYSEFRTPVSPLGKSEDVLGKDIKITRTPTAQPTPAIKTEEKVIAPPTQPSTTAEIEKRPPEAPKKSEAAAPQDKATKNKFFWFKKNNASQELKRETKKESTETQVKIPVSSAAAPITVEGNKIDLRLENKN